MDISYSNVVSLQERRRRKRRRLIIRAIGRLCLCLMLTMIVSIGIIKLARYGLSELETYAGDVETDAQASYDHVSDAEKTDRAIVTKTPANSSVNRDDSEWNLMLVNASHPLELSYENNIQLTRLRNDQAIDSRCYPYLQRMMDDCRAAGLRPVICSSFRTRQRQQELFDKQIEVYVSRGYSREDAKEKTATSVAIPGTSEHELGLAVDIVDQYNQKVDQSQEGTAVNEWMKENCWKYGFILRYPPDCYDITGIIYEPWHFRFVGEEAAREIHERGVTLEEYLDEQ